MPPSTADRAAPRIPSAPRRLRLRAGLLAGAAGLAVSGAALAQSDAAGGAGSSTTVTHAYTNFGTPVYGPDFEHLDYVNPEAPKGGEMSFSTTLVFDSFNLWTRRGVPEGTASDIVYESMLTGTADDPYALYCYLCETMEYPEDVAWVTFTLRDGITFHDGSAVTASDIAFFYETILEQGIAEFRNIVQNFITDIEVLDDRRIRFSFSEESPRRDRIGIAGLATAISQDQFEEEGLRLDESQPRPFIGTGPYVLDRVDIGRSAIYRKDPDWWAADLPMNRGRWNFETIRVEVFADASASMEAFSAGEYLFREENSSLDWATSYDFPAVREGHVIKAELPDGSIGSAQGFIFNLRREPWQDPAVREAVSMVFNFEWSNQTLFYGLYERPVSFWQNTDLMAEGPPGEDEAAILTPLVEEGLLSEAILTEEAALPQQNEAAGNTPSRRVLREAGRLLEEAGWTFEEGARYRSRDGRTLSLTILQTSPLYDRIVNPYVENLRRIGVDARLERVDSAQYVQRRREGAWDLTNHTLTQGYEPGLGLRQWFDSSTAEDSSRNLMALADPAVDRIITEVIAADTLEEVESGARALDRVLRNLKFWIPQWYSAEHLVAYWDVYDHPDPLPPLTLGALDLWWWVEEDAQALREAGAL